MTSRANNSTPVCDKKHIRAKILSRAFLCTLTPQDHLLPFNFFSKVTSVFLINTLFSGYSMSTENFPDQQQKPLTYTTITSNNTPLLFMNKVALPHRRLLDSPTSIFLKFTPLTKFMFTINSRCKLLFITLLFITIFLDTPSFTIFASCQSVFTNKLLAVRDALVMSV